MLFAFALIAFAQISLKLNWFDLLKPVAEISHDFCISRAPSSHWKDFYMAIVCAEPLPESSFKQALKLSSLLHIIVVSGTHLLVVEIILRKISLLFPRLKFLTPIVLVAFALATLLSPPAIRAILHLLVSKFNASKKLFLSPIQITWLSSYLIIAIFPDWLNSISLILSTAASLSVILFFNGKFSAISSHTLTYLFMAVFLLPIGVPHPLAILFNLIFVPVVGGILFPLNLICFVWPGFTVACDWLWLVLNKLLLIFTAGLTPIAQHEVSMLWLWTLLFLIQITIILNQRRKNG